MRQLFRQEAIDAQREKRFGEAVRARPLATWVLSLTALGFAAALVAFLLWGEYARRERVEGYLALDAGAARILIPEAGTLAELLVREGEEVAAGAPLARITFEHATKSGAPATERVEKELNERLAAVAREMDQARSLNDQQSDALRKRIDDLQRELGQLDVEVRLQTQRVVSAQQLADRYKDLVRDKFVSEIVAQQKVDDVIDQRMKLQSLKREQSKLETDLRAARAEAPTLATKTSSELERLRRQESELQQTLVQEEARREVVIRSPIAGTITNIALTRGQSVSDDTTLGTVIPAGSGLHAELLVPSRAIGFIEPGQRVVLRYEAFPFQRFGQYEGTVYEISRTVWSPGERVGPVTVREPVYRVDVKLARQAVGVEGQTYALRPGMVLGADILLERRTLLEWLFEPVLGLKERLR